MSVLVDSLGPRGEQIGRIVSVVNDIAAQTNLLALNAANGASPAGDARKLAERTQRAAEEIADSITAIQSETVQAVKRMNTCASRVESVVCMTSETDQGLQRIVATASDVAMMIQTIAAAAEEQAATSESGKSDEWISLVSRRSSDGIGPTSMVAAQLFAKAEHLQALVGRFKIENGA